MSPGLLGLYILSKGSLGPCSSPLILQPRSAQCGSIYRVIMSSSCSKKLKHPSRSFRPWTLVPGLWPLVLVLDPLPLVPTLTPYASGLRPLPLVLGIWLLVPGFWSLASGPWSPSPRSQSSQTQSCSSPFPKPQTNKNLLSPHSITNTTHTTTHNTISDSSNKFNLRLLLRLISDYHSQSLASSPPSLIQSPESANSIYIVGLIRLQPSHLPAYTPRSYSISVFSWRNMCVLYLCVYVCMSVCMQSSRGEE
jgi:hypothetical protein